jgi:hypothetical protein
MHLAMASRTLDETTVSTDRGATALGHAMAARASCTLRTTGRSIIKAGALWSLDWDAAAVTIELAWLSAFGMARAAAQFTSTSLEWGTATSETPRLRDSETWPAAAKSGCPGVPSSRTRLVA